MRSDELLVTYRIETPYPVEEAARAMAGEQSSGTFVDVPGETASIRERHGATVLETKRLEDVAEPSLPGSKPPNEPSPPKYRRADVTLAFPLENIGTSLPNVVTTAAGNIFELQELSGLRVVDIGIPSALAEAYPGPQFGIDGTRALLNAENEERPLIGTIIKPNVGLSPAETASLVSNLVEAGIDFVKDDELIANPPYSPVEERVTAVMDVIDEHRDATGREVLYACNITDDLEAMYDHHDAVVDAGGNCIMVSMNSVGLGALKALREHASVPIHAHRNGWGALSRCPLLGFEYEVYQTFFRLAGADHLHVNGLQNKFSESDASVIRSAEAVQTPIDSPDDAAMPVFSSGQWAGQAPDTYEALGNGDLLYLAGGGILGHPDGPAAGVRHLKQGWEAAMNGIPLEEYAETHEELRVAIEHYGDHR